MDPGGKHNIAAVDEMHIPYYIHLIFFGNQVSQKHHRQKVLLVPDSQRSQRTFFYEILNIVRFRIFAHCGWPTVVAGLNMKAVQFPEHHP
jgi:hypothetical protein